MTRRRHAAGVLSAAALALHLHSLGLVRYPPDSPGVAVPAYVETLPSDAPDHAVLVQIRPGPAPDTVSAWDYPIVRVLVRGPADGPSEPVLSVLRAIKDAIHRTHNTVWAADTVHEKHITECEATTSGQIPEGHDPKGRPAWSLNFAVETLENVA